MITTRVVACISARRAIGLKIRQMAVDESILEYEGGKIDFARLQVSIAILIAYQAKNSMI